MTASGTPCRREIAASVSPGATTCLVITDAWMDAAGGDAAVSVEGVGDSAIVVAVRAWSVAVGIGLLVGVAGTSAGAVGVGKSCEGIGVEGGVGSCSAIGVQLGIASAVGLGSETIAVAKAGDVADGDGRIVGVHTAAPTGVLVLARPGAARATRDPVLRSGGSFIWPATVHQPNAATANRVATMPTLTTGELV